MMQKMTAIFFTVFVSAALFSADWVELSRMQRPYQGTELKEWGKDWDVKTEKGTMLISWAQDIRWWKDFGSLYETYIRYQGSGTSLEKLLIDGSDAATLTGHKGKKVIWFRFFPKKVKKGNIVTVLIQFRQQPVKPFKLALTSGDKELFTQTVDLKNVQKEDLISRIAMSDDMKSIYIWLKTKQNSLSLKKVFLDGKDWTGSAKTRPLYAGTLPILLPLKEPLKNGSRHTIHLEHSAGKCSISFRAFPGKFNFAIYQGPDGKNIKSHNFDIFWSHRCMKPDQVRSYHAEGIQAISPFYEKPENYQNVPGIFADYLPDEPDIKDIRDHKQIKWMGQRLGMEAPGMAKLADDQERNTPHFVSAIVVGKSNRPGNFFAYRRISDLFATDYYCISSDIQPLLCYPSARIMRIANEPLASWFIAGCFSRPVNSKWKRFPTQSEIRYMTLSAIAGGAQSMAFWMYPDGNSTKGPASNPALWNSMGLVNGEFKAAAHLLEKTCPVNNAVIHVPESLIAQVLRTVDDSATLVVLLNKNARSDAKGLTVPEISDFNAVLTLPAGCNVNRICKLTIHGPQNVTGFKQKDGKLHFPVKALQEGAVYILAHTTGITEKIADIHKNVILPNNQAAKKILDAKLLFQLAPATQKAAFRCEFETIMPENAKHAVNILTNGDLRFGVRWSNSKNRLNNKTVAFTLIPEKPEVLREIKLLTSVNRWYAMKSIAGTVFFTDGTTYTLETKAGFPGGWQGKGNKNHVFHWQQIPEKQVRKIRFTVLPHPFFGIMIGEAELIRK